MTTAPAIEPDPQTVYTAVRDHHEHNHERSVEAFKRYIDWVRSEEVVVDVCRAAGERFQAARLFQHLAAKGIEAAATPALLLNDLSDDWYLVHMLTMHPSSSETKSKRRILRLLDRLVDAESAATLAVLR